MRRFHRRLRRPFVSRPLPFEIAGLGLIATGIWQVSEPAAFVVAGAALVLIAQGLERRQ